MTTRKRARTRTKTRRPNLLERLVLGTALVVAPKRQISNRTSVKRLVTPKRVRKVQARVRKAQNKRCRLCGARLTVYNRSGYCPSTTPQRCYDVATRATRNRKARARAQVRARGAFGWRGTR